MSRNKKVFNSNKCETIQKVFLENQSSSLHLNIASEISQHLNSCQDCQDFIHHISIIKDSMNTSYHKSIQPRPYIIRRLIAYIRKKPHPRPSLTERIQSFLNYPIPAYQVLTGMLLLLALTIGFGIVSGSGKDSDSVTETFYLADSTQKLLISKGKTVYEDTLWSRYMVTF